MADILARCAKPPRFKRDRQTEASAHLQDELATMAAALKNVRIGADAYADLKAMADEDGLTLREEMDRLIQHTKRARFFEKLSAQHGEMSEEERVSYREEMNALEGPMSDGLPDDEFPADDAQ